MTYGPAAGREKNNSQAGKNIDLWAGRRPGKKQLLGRPQAGKKNRLMGRPQAGTKSMRYGAVRGGTGRYGAVRVWACTPFKFLLGRYAGPVEQEQEQQQQER